MTGVLLRRERERQTDTKEVQTQERSCEDTARRRLSASQGERPQEKQTCWPLDLELPASRNVRNKFVSASWSVWFCYCSRGRRVQTAWVKWQERGRAVWGEAKSCGHLESRARSRSRSSAVVQEQCRDIYSLKQGCVRNRSALWKDFFGCGMKN